MRGNRVDLKYCMKELDVVNLAAKFHLMKEMFMTTANKRGKLWLTLFCIPYMCRWKGD